MSNQPRTMMLLPGDDMPIEAWLVKTIPMRTEESNDSGRNTNVMKVRFYRVGECEETWLTEDEIRLYGNRARLWSEDRKRGSIYQAGTIQHNEPSENVDAAVEPEVNARNARKEAGNTMDEMKKAADGWCHFLK